jgi:short-subunit dehydrogenase
VCLVYNAAALGRDAPMELTGDELAARLMVDVVGAKVAADVVVPRLRDGKGSVLFTGGGLGLQPAPAYTSLSIGKAALRAYAAVLHEELRPKAVHVTCVTIAGRIGGGEPRFAPETIAGVYVGLHRQPEIEWSPELVYD